MEKEMKRLLTSQEMEEARIAYQKWLIDHDPHKMTMRELFYHGYVTRILE
jgi:hypothetical protein